MGLGLFGGGLAVARHLASKGADVLVTDLRDASQLTESLARLQDLPLRLRLGEHREEDFTGADLVVVNPAVPPLSPFVAAARRAGVPLTSELELFVRACSARRVFAVTGTNGKTTTVTLLGHLLQRAHPRTFVGGNLGRSLLECLGEICPEDFVVLEVSSYQLESLDPGRPWPEVSVVTNLSPDHLERHGTMEQYAAAKRRLVEGQDGSGIAILNFADSRVRTFAGATRAQVQGFARTSLEGVSYTLADRGGGPWFVERLEGRQTWLAPVSALEIPGAFHQENALAAFAAARSAGLEVEGLAEGLRSFRGVPHRLQKLPPVGGVAVFDNAVSTVPESTISAFEAMPLGTHWIGGGRSKGLDLAALVRAAAARRIRAYLYGEVRVPLADALERAGVPSERSESLAGAFAAARACARPGDTVLYSPAFLSHDQYRNFADRASEFLALVERWRGEATGAAGVA